MKILHTEASCGWGGQEIRILEESRGLIARGHQVSVACPAHARMAAEAARFGVSVTALPIEFKTVAGFLALRNHLASHPVDVVNTHSSADSWLTGLACATLATPPAIVRTRHISAPVSGNFANRWLYSQAKGVVTTGESLRRHLLQTLALDPARVTSVPTGIDTERFSPVMCAADKAAAKTALGLDPECRHIGIVATLRSWKGHLFLLDAFARLMHPGLHLLIVGEGPMRGPIEEKIATLGLGERATLVGQQSDPERWLQAMDVFCLPSYANEGVPQAILQAMLCALPIVTTPVGAILEAVTDGKSALVVAPKNADALGAAIARLLDDGALAAQLGAEARRVASADFSREAMLDSMETIFHAAFEVPLHSAAEAATTPYKQVANRTWNLQLKILVVGDYTSIPLTRGCADALESLECEVLHFDSEDRTGPIVGAVMRHTKSLAKLLGLKQKLSDYYASRIYGKRRNNFLKKVQLFSPDVILVIRGNHFDIETLRHLRRRARLVCWFIRDHKRAAAIRQEAPEYDLYYSQHRSHEADGISYLPVCTYDSANYFPDASVSKDIPLLFVGGWTSKRQKWIETLTNVSAQLSIIGPHWRTKFERNNPLLRSVKAEWVSGTELRNWYQRAQVVININQWDASELSGANLRVADVPACGTVLLSEYSEDLEEYFNLGQELTVFRNAEEMKDLCLRLLTDEPLRHRMESAGMKAVHRIGTYRDRMTRILEDVSKLPPLEESPQ